MPRIRVRALTLAAAYAVPLLSGCGIFHRAAERDLLWPEGMSAVRVHWTAEPGIDLTAGIAVPVRAYLESYDLVVFTGNIDNAYPGFLDAVPPNEASDRSNNRSAWDRRPLGLPSRAGTSYSGNLGFHLQTVQHTDSGATVTVCEYRYALGARRYEGDYDPVITGGLSVNRGIVGLRLDLVAPTDDATAGTLPSQRGPAAVPAVNVFGGWQIVGLQTTSSTGTDEWPTKQQVVADCVATAPDPPERRNELARGPLSAADFASSPAVPGWPE